MVIAALLNIGLDCLFVFVFKWGIFGAALASVIAQGVSFLYCLNCLRKVDVIDLSKEAWILDWKLIKNLIGFGIPVALRFIVVALGGIILQSSINVQGSNSQAVCSWRRSLSTGSAQTPCLSPSRWPGWAEHCF